MKKILESLLGEVVVKADYGKGWDASDPKMAAIAKPYSNEQVLEGAKLCVERLEAFRDESPDLFWYACVLTDSGDNILYLDPDALDNDPTLQKVFSNSVSKPFETLLSGIMDRGPDRVAVALFQDPDTGEVSEHEADVQGPHHDMGIKLPGGVVVPVDAYTGQGNTKTMTWIYPKGSGVFSTQGHKPVIEFSDIVIHATGKKLEDRQLVVYAMTEQTFSLQKAMLPNVIMRDLKARLEKRVSLGEVPKGTGSGMLPGMEGEAVQTAKDSYRQAVDMLKWLEVEEKYTKLKWKLYRIVQPLKKSHLVGSVGPVGDPPEGVKNFFTRKMWKRTGKDYGPEGREAPVSARPGRKTSKRVKRNPNQARMF